MTKERPEPNSAETRGTHKRRQELRPLRPVLLITRRGPCKIASVSAADVGCKALGLCTLPLEWTRPFFVVSAECFEAEISRDELNSWVSECVTQTPFTSPNQLIIRSSGMVEGMSDRGSLFSEHCAAFQIVPTIELLRNRISRSSRPYVHWIVQEAIGSRRSGHISNERRVSKEPRDWLIEFDAFHNYRGYTVSIGIRTWREGGDISSFDLACESEAEVPRQLRKVAKWGMRFVPRIHFEWVWDGRKLWIVQADAEEFGNGKDPTVALTMSISEVDIGNLDSFRLAEAADYEIYHKLRNAALYRELGYEMPSFFVIDDPSAIARILRGDFFDDLEKDLDSLTKRPLIIRTDGVSIPDKKREMLPRSDPLASIAEAKEWLLNYFRVEINKADLGDDLCLIAHHFIPSVASAWARAEPDTRLVRIEALWGIPEGLYWYSHDVFEVDTQDVRLPDVASLDNTRFSVSEKRLRYKGTFVAADESGKWTPCKVSAPFDWRSSIKKKKWLFNIALSTRRISESEDYPVAVMWFVNNHPDATQHKVLPWYHFRSELVGPRRAGPRHKLTSSTDFVIKNKGDWEELQQRLQSGPRVERVVVEPVDTALIRNPAFAKKLGRLGATKRFVIELSGGILSHAYYIFTKEGAQVECIDLFGVDEELAEYNKIVRDRIPEIISKRGERTESIRLKNEALITGLREKLVEESFEVLDAKSSHDLIGELADVSEVINALCNALGISSSHLGAVQKEKRKKRGGFEKGVMLTRTGTPHSIPHQRPKLPKPLLTLKAGMPEAPAIERRTDLPTKPLYRRPDLRRVDRQPEKLFTFATETNKLGDLRATLRFSLPIDNRIEQHFSLTLELQRLRELLRGNIRIRLLPWQPSLKFVDNKVKMSRKETVR